MTPSRRRYTRKQRSFKAGVRTVWASVSPAIGFCVVWMVNSFSDIGLPWWIGVPIGGACYGLKRYFWPDEEF
ncbi:MAG: hypothetical protein ABFE13_12025 [Phycisphaerales bacterium]